MATVTRTQQAELKRLATEINAAHTAVRANIDQAHRAGDGLAGVKKILVKHGEWLKWVAANTEVSEQVAQIYMRIAKHWAQLEEFRNAYPDTHLDITKARWLIAHNFVDDEQDPDDAAVADLAPGGYDDAATSNRAAKTGGPANTSRSKQPTVARDQQRHPFHMDFPTEPALKEFRDQLKTVAGARNFPWGSPEGDVVRAIVRQAYDDATRQARQPVA